LPDSPRPNEHTPEPSSIADAIFPPTVPGQAPHPPVEPDHDSPQPDAPDATPPAQSAALGDTAGTGTIIALGCIGATAFLIVVGIVIILLLQVF
jgi:hypothetical protein